MNYTPLVIKRPKAVLFDYDGVLVASEPIHLSAWMQLLAEIGLPADAKMIQSAAGKTAPEIIARFLDLHKPGWTPEQYDVHALALQKNTYYLPLAKSSLVAYPGVKEGIQWLRSQGIATAVVSNGKRRELVATMDHLGLTPLMDLVLSRDDVTAYKPDPTPYLFAAASLGFKPKQCVAIEDSPTGLEAALMAKIPAGGVTTNFSAEALRAPVLGRPDLRPHWIGGSMVEFFDWLRGLER